LVVQCGNSVTKCSVGQKIELYHIALSTELTELYRIMPISPETVAAILGKALSAWDFVTQSASSHVRARPERGCGWCVFLLPLFFVPREHHFWCLFALLRLF